MDGTYVPILKPTTNEGAYLTRHHCHGLNVLVVMDADHRILYMNSTFSGSFHYTHCWHMSNPHEAITLRNRLQGNHIIAANGYPLSPWLLIPFSPMQLWTCTDAEKKWNRQLIIARISAERGLALYKGRWHVIS